MDTVFIEGLEVETLIGAYDWERHVRQCLQLDLRLAWDIRAAAHRDELDKALDYAEVAQVIESFAAESGFRLVETFADRLAAHLMARFGIRWIQLRVTKPGVNPRGRRLGVEIERGQR